MTARTYFLAGALLGALLGLAAVCGLVYGPGVIWLFIALAVIWLALLIVALVIHSLVEMGLGLAGTRLREAIEEEAMAVPSWDPYTVELTEIAGYARAELAEYKALETLRAEDQPDPEPAVVRERAKRRRDPTRAAAA